MQPLVYPYFYSYNCTSTVSRFSLHRMHDTPYSILAWDKRALFDQGMRICPRVRGSCEANERLNVHSTEFPGAGHRIFSMPDPRTTFACPSCDIQQSWVQSLTKNLPPDHSSIARLPYTSCAMTQRSLVPSLKHQHSFFESIPRMFA